MAPGTIVAACSSFTASEERAGDAGLDGVMDASSPGVGVDATSMEGAGRCQSAPFFESFEGDLAAWAVGPNTTRVTLTVSTNQPNLGSGSLEVVVKPAGSGLVGLTRIVSGGCVDVRFAIRPSPTTGSIDVVRVNVRSIVGVRSEQSIV
jgi:hypothetical protein